jgi:hypothetical protein
MVETPIYDGLVSELGDTLAEVRALFSQHVVDDALEQEVLHEDTATAADHTDQLAAAAA